MRIGVERSVRRVLGGAALLAGVWFVAEQQACSQLNTTEVQCLSEAECLAKGPKFAGTTCDPVTKTCVFPEAGLVGCTSNTQCATQLGVAAICRQSDQTCQALVTDECPDVYDATMALQGNPNVIVLGSLTPENDSVLGLEMAHTVELAQYDLTNTALGGLPALPGQMGVRPVVFVNCNEFGAGFAGLL